jgi:hypothetical protein
MTAPLMPKATAVWLVENTALTFDQIAEFCELHPLEVQGIADGDVASGIIGEDPIINGQLTSEEIKRCEQDPQAKLALIQMSEALKSAKKKKEAKYIPVARRRDKPDGILWLVKNYPEVTDAQIIKLLGTTKSTVSAIRDRKHWDIANMKPRDPVLLGICSQVALDKLIQDVEEARRKKEEGA